MGRSNQRRYVAAALSAALILGSGCGAFATEPQTQTVLIGVDLGLTGEGAPLGNVYQDALRLRVEQVNRQQLLGEQRRLELTVLDNRSDPATSASNLAEFASDPAVAAIITGGCDECAIAAAETINDLGVPTVALGGAEDIAEPVTERRFVFRLGPTASHNAALLARELGRDDEVTTIAVVTTEDRYGAQGAEEFTGAADRNDLQVVMVESLTAEEESAQQVASAIVAYDPLADPDVAQDPEPEPGVELPAEPATGPDAVVLWVPPAGAEQVASQLRDAGYEGRFVLDAIAADEVFLSGQDAAALQGAVMIFTETLVIDEVIATSPAKTARQAWFRDYTARYGTYQAYSALAADALGVIVLAINRFDNPDREIVRNAMESTVLDGLIGPIRISSENHSGLAPQALTTLVARGDRWRLTG